MPVDRDGMQVVALREEALRLGRRPKVIYTIPTFQNPSGATMTL